MNLKSLINRNEMLNKLIVVMDILIISLFAIHILTFQKPDTLLAFFAGWSFSDLLRKALDYSSRKESQYAQ